jgi:hypothetical protein
MAPAPLDWLVSGACYVASVPFRLLSQSNQLVPPERMLILKPCCIGDVLLATPVAVALQRAFPGVRIDWAVGPWSRQMVATNPRLGKIINAEEIGVGRFSWPMINRLVRRIRAERYDTCLVLDRSPVLAMIPWLGRNPPAGRSRQSWPRLLPPAARARPRGPPRGRDLPGRRAGDGGRHPGCQDRVLPDGAGSNRSRAAVAGPAEMGRD